MGTGVRKGCMEGRKARVGRSSSHQMTRMKGNPSVQMVGGLCCLLSRRRSSYGRPQGRSRQMGRSALNRSSQTRWPRLGQPGRNQSSRPQLLESSLEVAPSGQPPHPPPSGRTRGTDHHRQRFGSLPKYLEVPPTSHSRVHLLTCTVTPPCSASLDG